MLYLIATLWQFLTWGVTGMVALHIVTQLAGPGFLAWLAGLAALLLSAWSAYQIETTLWGPEGDW